MCVNILDDKSYVKIIEEIEIYDDMDCMFHDDYETKILTIQFFFNERDLMKFKLQNDMVMVDEYKIELSDQEWIRADIRNGRFVEQFMVEDGIIILPFGLLIKLIKCLPKRVKNDTTRKIEKISRYFSKDDESHNSVIEFHKANHFKKYEDTVKNFNGYKK